jgi:hypothetical protein
VNRRGFLRSLAGLIATAAVAPADILKIALPEKVRKLRSTWTMESANDLRALHGVDVEAELIWCLIEEIKKSCDRHFLGLE